MLGMLLFSLQLLAQNRTVTGRVTDASGNPIPSASVQVKNMNVGTVTREDGTYSLALPATARTLVVSAVGQTTQEVSIENSNTINVTLLAGSQQNLQEVVVVGYGTQRRGTVTGSQVSIKAADIANTPITNPQQALQGRASGVLVTQASGTPGGGISVRVRGPGSISGSNQPLYVVDGIPINTGSYTQLAAGGQLTNAISDINPNDIESIEVLKDAAASAIYGSRAANGVVLITTKRGANAPTRISFNTYYGTQEVAKTIPVLTGQQYIELLNEATANRYGAGRDYNFLTGLSANPSDYANTNWQDEVFRTAPMQNYELGFRGGNERTRFSISGSYFDQDGIVIGSGYKRYSGRINLDNQATSKLKLIFSSSFSSSENNRINNDNNIYGVVSAAVLMGTHVPVYNANGTYGRDPVSSVDNPIAQAKENTFTFRSNRLLASAGAEYRFLPSLLFRTNLSLDYLSTKDRSFLSTLTNNGAGTGGSATEGQSQDVNVIFENTLTYTQTFNENHNFSILGGFSYQESNFESLLAAATGFPGNDIRRLSAGSVRTTASSGGTSWALESYFSRANYSYKNKYLLQVSARLDGSSRFGSQNRYGFFPAVSAGWRISEEEFFGKGGVISELKVRGGYGVTGNQEIGNFTSLALVGGGANYLQNAGLTPTQLGNDSLRWERSKSANVGLDLSMFSNRLTFTFDAYRRNTSDLLLGRPLVGASGFTTIQSNIGSIRNEGLEFGLGGTILRKRDFTWDANLNLTFNRNRVVAISGSPFAQGFASWVEAGQPLGAFRGYRVVGIFQSASEIASAPVHTVTSSALTSTAPGDIRFADLNGDNRITGADQEIIGSGLPTYFGGFTNNFKYKGFDLSAFLQFSGGNEIYNNTRAFSEGMNSVFGQFASTLDRWQPGKTSTTMPRAVYGDPNNNRRVSTRWLEDGDYLRLKNISIGYTFGPNVLDRLHFTNLRLYVASQNLFTITNYSGFDPEVSTFSDTNTSPGTDFLTFPQARVFTFGLNLTF
jgi:TonB-linked SusC/RagA family outer membrane protein